MARNELSDRASARTLGGFAAGKLNLSTLSTGLQPEALVLSACLTRDWSDEQEGCLEVRRIIGESVLEDVDDV